MRIMRNKTLLLSHISIVTLTILFNKALAQNCSTRCCFRSDSTHKPCPIAKVDHLSITLTPQKIAIVCRNPISPSDNKEVVMSFDANYLMAIDQTSLSLAFMINKCSKTIAKHVVYALDSKKFKALSASEDILYDNALKYLKFENKIDKDRANVTLFEKHFLRYGSQLSTVIINNLNVNNLKDYLKNLSHVETLDLASNGIEILNITTLNNLSNLKSLSLRNNKIAMLDTAPNVTYLDLSHNKIRKLSKMFFLTAPGLQLLNLSNNDLTTIEEGAFQLLPKLQNLDLSNNLKLSFKANDFSNLTSIQSLNMSSCSLSKLPSRFCQNCQQLLVLNISDNAIEHLEDNSLASLTNLEIMDLSFNMISALPKNLLQPLKKLKQVYLSCNRLTAFESHVFSILDILDLSYNSIKSLARFRARSVMLRNNSISEFPSNFLTNMTDLRHVDLSYNNITYVRLDKDAVPKGVYVEIDLSYNHIADFRTSTATTKNDWKVMLDLSNNLVRCNCLHYQVEPLQSYSTIIQVNSKEDICYNHFPDDNCPLIYIDGCPKECNCYYTRPNNAVTVDCSKSNLIVFPEIGRLVTDRYQHNQTMVMLNGNKLNKNEQNRLGNYSNVSTLDLSNNFIESLNWIPKEFEVLKLVNNSLKFLSSDLIEALKSNKALKNVSLKGNPWKCDCNALPLQKFLKENNADKLSSVVNQQDVICQETGESITYSILCEKENLLKVALPLGLTIPLAIISALAALYYKFSTSIKVFLYSKNLCLWCVAEEELDKDKAYDVFISFSHKDENFVQTELLPELENGDHPFKICIHYRDWLPGEFISQQIVNSVLDSRRTLVVLSNNFMESVWGKMEFRTAHLQAINEGRARVIVVLYGDLDQDTLDDEMKTYLKTNTYVQWGDQWFWSKLKYALPHSKSRRRYTVQDSQESFNLN